jgi:hypothetical protein
MTAKKILVKVCKKQVTKLQCSYHRQGWIKTLFETVSLVLLIFYNSINAKPMLN